MLRRLLKRKGSKAAPEEALTFDNSIDADAYPRGHSGVEVRVPDEGSRYAVRPGDSYPSPVGERAEVKIVDAEGTHVDTTGAPVEEQKMVSVPASDDNVIVWKDKGEEYRWKRVASNGKLVSESGEGYKKLSYAMEQAGIRNSDVDKSQIKFVIGAEP